MCTQPGCTHDCSSRRLHAAWASAPGQRPRRLALFAPPRRRLFKRKQRGKIGLALNGDWYEAKPAADLEEQRRNEKAAERALEFTLGWFARPVYQVRARHARQPRTDHNGTAHDAAEPARQQWRTHSGSADGLPARPPSTSPPRHCRRATTRRSCASAAATACHASRRSSARCWWALWTSSGSTTTAATCASSPAGTRSWRRRRRRTSATASWCVAGRASGSRCWQPARMKRGMMQQMEQCCCTAVQAAARLPAPAA